MFTFTHGEMDGGLSVGKEAADKALPVANDPAAIQIAANDETAAAIGIAWILHTASHHVLLPGWCYFIGKKL